jgi:hypothetical protein
MTRIIVDDSFTNQLPEANTPCIVLNAAGKKLGYFTPDLDPASYQGLDPTVSDDELARREQAGGGRALSEILSDLQQGQ